MPAVYLHEVYISWCLDTEDKFILTLLAQLLTAEATTATATAKTAAAAAVPQVHSP